MQKQSALKSKLSCITIFISVILVFIGSNNIEAYASLGYESYDSYVVIDNRKVVIPETYTIYKVINSFEVSDGESPFFQNPLDICIDQKGFIYVADTGNNRIVKLNQDGQVENIFKGPDSLPFRSPEGIFVDPSGDIYVADTGNERIVHIAPDGSFVEEFTAPKSDLLDESVPFSVSKIAVSETGYIYAIRGENILIMDAYNRFRGYMGQSKIGFSLVDALLRIFASEEQSKFVQKRLAATFLSIELGSDGMLYATNLDREEGEIKRLNSVGNNTYRKYKTISSESDFSLWNKIKKRITEGNYITKSFRFGEININEAGAPELPIFRDICVDQYGNVTVIEETTGRIYQYDKDGNALAVFGGLGERKGTFLQPTAIAVDTQGKIYVLDSLRNNLQIFEPTTFIKLVHSAVNEYNNGNYDNAFHYWQQVLNINENYELAHIGIANVLYKQEKFREAMEMFKLADDREGYSKAFTEYRYEFFRRHFLVVVLVITTLIITIIFVLFKLTSLAKEYNEELIKDENKKLGIHEGILFGFNILLHPAETFETIKYNREKLNAWSALIIYILVFLIRIVYILFVHYPLADIDIKNANLFFEAMRSLLPPLVWVLASFAVTSIMDGESKIRDIFIASAYCMLPLIIVKICLIGLSNIISLNEKVLFSTITNLTTIWILILYFVNIKVLNDYRFSKAIGTYLLTGIAMLIILFIGLLLYVLAVRLIQFIAGIGIEIRTTWL